MPFWAIYRTLDGELCEVVDAAPSVDALAEQGKGVAFFGDDHPDMQSLCWCPRRLTFAARPSDLATVERLQSLSNRLRPLEEALLAAEVRLASACEEIDGLAEWSLGANARHDLLYADTMDLSRRSEGVKATLLGMIAETDRALDRVTASLADRVGALEADLEKRQQKWWKRLGARGSG